MLDRAALVAATRAHGRVVRVVIPRVRGSAPREVGAAMLVWADGQSGTIGGGALEYALTGAARSLTADTATSHALGPEMGQCCGGAVEALSEIFDTARAEALPGRVFARGPGPMPARVRRLIDTDPAQARKVDGWFVEPVAPRGRPLWIWGAGHVGRALVAVVADLPGFALTWIDTGPERFPGDVDARVKVLPAADLLRVVAHAPQDAAHLIVTHSHALDLDLCHALLTHGFARCGLIGSGTKWARFRNRLRDLGHGPQAIARINCPIGDPALGKHPQAIAVGVAHALLTDTMGDVTIPQGEVSA